jgi:Glycosyl hydrolase-like 10
VKDLEPSRHYLILPMKIDKNQKKGAGCSRIPLSLILAVLGGSYWWLIHQGNINKVAKLLPNFQPVTTAVVPIVGAKTVDKVATIPTSIEPSIAADSITPPIEIARKPKLKNSPQPVNSSNPVSSNSNWEKKAIRGIYLSRYQITNNASEATIRQRVRYYHSQGINTIIHGVWGNGCTMYNSPVMQQMLGAKSCPNLFQDPWLEWTIDEAHQQGMQVHAYFEKGIKIDKNSPIFAMAVAKKWLVPGVDKTYSKIDHYVLDVEVPEVANLFKKMLAEFVTKYPKIDAVQWDDYLGYHAQLPGKVNRTASLTKFVTEMISEMKAANPAVSFDICHHNPYWAKRYFAADWENWKVDRVFIQDYNEKNFKDELNYVVKYEGVAITDNQLHRLKEITDNPRIKSILIFPLGGKPEDTAARVRQTVENNSAILK